MALRRGTKRAAKRWAYIVTALVVFSCGKTDADTSSKAGGGAGGGAGSTADSNFGGSMPDAGGAGGVQADAAEADACDELGFGAYQNSACCPGVPNCGQLTDWYCNTSNCVDKCPLPFGPPGSACQVGRACYARFDVGCMASFCICYPDGWRCATGNCYPGCAELAPGDPCAESGKVCQYGTATCTCTNGAWSCEIAGDAG